jgi:hypothetical protein
MRTQVPALARRSGILVVAGSGLPTLDAIELLGTKSGSGTFVDGDGTVSLESVTAGKVFREHSVTFRLDHVALVRNRVSITAVIVFLESNSTDY